MTPSPKENDITQFLPQRPPFLMVDKWLYIDEKKVATVFLIPEDCIFIDKGRLLESGLIENAAQTCSTIVGKSFIDSYGSETQAKKLIGFISAIKKVEIFNLPATGVPITTKAELVSRFDTDNYCICSMKCTTYLNETRLLYCELNLIIQEVDE